MRWMGWSYPDLLACPADYWDELVAMYERWEEAQRGS